VEIRSATAADIAAVLALWQHSRSGVASVSDDEAMIERLLATNPDALLVAERDGEIVATLIAAWDGWRGNMYRLAVAADLRRSGIATELVLAGERRLRDLGCFRITALVWGEDDPALGFWGAAGYSHDSRIHRYVRMV
jgi:ribosomal protein S18 acetylase RimI-like enzyme